LQHVAQRDDAVVTRLCRDKVIRQAWVSKNHNSPVNAEELIGKHIRDFIHPSNLPIAETLAEYLFALHNVPGIGATLPITLTFEGEANLRLVRAIPSSDQEIIVFSTKLLTARIAP